MTTATTRLYLDDPDVLRFEARILEVRPFRDGSAALLDRTAFYPEGGGQPADRGLLGGAEVVDVQEVDGEILHVLAGAAGPGVAAPEPVVGEVDAARRRDHVQQHHGQHLLSAAFEVVAGARTISFHLGAETCTIDLDAPPPKLGPEVLRAAEARANDVVFRDLPVSAREFDAAELAALPLRKEPAKGSRVVVVGDAGDIIDASPCGGTHPRRTGVVGAIAVLRASKWGAGTRVEFICGGRVVRALAEAHRLVADAAAPLRCAPAELSAAVSRLADEATARRKELDRAAGLLADLEAARLVEAHRDGRNIRAVVTVPLAGAAGFAKAVALAVASRGRLALIGAIEDGRAHLAFARPKGSGPHLGEILRAAAGVVGGKGGGAPEAAQGSGPDAIRLEAALEQAALAVEQA